jgi:hypothetical protein
METESWLCDKGELAVVMNLRCAHSCGKILGRLFSMITATPKLGISQHPISHVQWDHCKIYTSVNHVFS